MVKKGLLFTGCIFLCEIVGILATPFTLSSISSWYMTLHKPFLSPPQWIFAPVWTILYALMGSALYLILMKGYKKKKVKIALLYFFAQLVCNFLWSIVFFGLRFPLLGLLDIIILDILIFLTIKTFFVVSKTAAFLLLPYLLWVSFAAILNALIVSLN